LAALLFQAASQVYSHGGAILRFLSPVADLVVVVAADPAVNTIATTTTQTMKTTMTNTARRPVTRMCLMKRKIIRPDTEPITKNCFKILNQMLCNNYRFYYSFTSKFLSSMLINN